MAWKQKRGFSGFAPTEATDRNKAGVKLSDRPLPTPRSYLGIHRVDTICARCDRFAELDLAALIAAGQGDVPLINLPLRCSSCGWGGHKIIVSGRSYPLGGDG